MPVLRFGDRPYFWNPWDEFERIRRGLDDLSRNFPLSKTRQGSTVFPALNVYEDGEHLVIQAELPGIKAADLDVSVEGETLTLKGQRQHKPKDGKISYHRREIDSGSFNRAVTLPCRVQTDA
ncbi:MAG: heat-shock protein Hsp20, partial [Desulfobulbaceae bacterium A2]